ncbi:MAG: hypothetical protein K5945_02765 [Bacteroidaceae bacterium]|nr:hypothetical protein [Bacteroidaceae bacterium]
MKNLKIMSLLLGGLLAFGSLTSCGDDDEPEVMKATSAKAEYVVNLSQDLLDAANVIIYYMDSNGEQAQETVTTTTWTKSVSFAKLPAQAGFSVQPTLKGEPTQEEYTIEATGQMTLTLLDQKGKTFGEPFVSQLLQIKGQLGPDYLEKYLTRISTRVSEAKEIAADGTFADTTISWGGNTDIDDPNRDTEITNEGATGKTRG